MGWGALHWGVILPFLHTYLASSKVKASNTDFLLRPCPYSIMAGPLGVNVIFELLMLALWDPVHVIFELVIFAL